jgi:acyl-CoA thioesterase I
VNAQLLVHRWNNGLLILSLFCLPSVLLPAWSQAEDPRPRIVAFGDSLTAGLGVGSHESYPAQLQQQLDALGYRYRVVNAGVSGETTAGGLRRVPWILNSKPEIVIVELGANDGLRGLSLDQTKQNLDRIIRQLRTAGVHVILAGMKLPPNYGTEYRTGFESIYPSLAASHRVPLIPFFLEGVAASAALNQADGIHPTKDGYRIIVQQILTTLRPLLDQRGGKTPPAQPQRPGGR